MATAKNTKKKVSISDLQPKAKRVIITHPSLDLADTWVDIVPAAQSLDYMLVAMRLRSLDVESLSPQEQFEIQAQMTTAVIKDWDGFGFDFDRDASIAFFMQPCNFWIRQQIDEASKEDTDFLQDA